ncbi:MAG: hypothetical protein ABIN89_23200 [Chitinophagaceae bacterium]
MDQTDTAINNKLKWRFWLFFCVAGFFIVWMKHYLSPLRSSEIVQYEMAKTVDTAAALTKLWMLDGKFDILVKSIYVDYIFIIIYCMAISTACRFISSLTKNEIFITAGSFFSYLIFAAGIFDVIENIAMSKDLHQAVNFANVSLVYKMAISKFSILLMTLFFIAVCFIFWLISAIKLKDKSWQRA